MSFRKDSLMFFENQLLLMLFALLSISLIPFLGTLLPVSLSLVFSVLIIVNTRIQNEYVTINDIGIMCHKAGNLQWEYKWSDIADLQRSSRFRMPSIEILVYSTKASEKAQLSGDYFQLCRKAKDALRKYYSPNGKPLF